MNNYEFSFQENITFSMIAKGFSEFLRIPLEKIGTEQEFLDQLFLSENEMLQIGIKLYFSSNGYKTFVTFIMANDIKDRQYIELASFLSQSLQTNVVMADITKCEPGYEQFLVFYPNGKCQKAYNLQDVFSRTGEDFDIFTFAEKMTIADIVKCLK